MNEVERMLGVVANPDHREEDPHPGRERFLRRDIDPRRWLRIVVGFNDDPTWVVIALVQDGHAIHYDDRGVVIGLTLLNVRWTLEREGELTLTWPEEHVAADRLDPVLAVA
jgi:hypothetical protein